MKGCKTTIFTRLDSLEMKNTRKARKVLRIDEQQYFSSHYSTECCDEDQKVDDEMGENFSTDESVTIYLRNFVRKTCG